MAKTNHDTVDNALIEELVLDLLEHSTNIEVKQCKNNHRRFTITLEVRDDYKISPMLERENKVTSED